MVGFQAGYNNTSGAGNTHVGIDAGYYNRTGAGNTTLGQQAGFGNPTTYNNSNNTFLGYKAGFSVQSGGSNTAVGYHAAYSLTTAGENVFVGKVSGYAITSGTSNTCVGISSGTSISTSGSNVCIGASAGSNITTIGNGSQNTCVGAGSNVTGTYSNAGAFGYNAVNNQASSTIFLGDGNLSGVYVNSTANYYIQSDGRFKFNVKEDVQGLEFIKKLRPVTYQVDAKKLDVFRNKSVNRIIARTYTDSTGTHTTNDTLPDPTLTKDYTQSTAIIHSGFIAQEVASATKNSGFNSTIVSIPADSNVSNYAISYSEVVVPLVKAVQELSKTQDSLMAEIATLKGGGQRNNNGDSTQGKAETTLQVELANNGNAILYQNEPNPFDGSTTIRYFIPENSTGNAYVGFYDMYGKEIKKLEITERGFGKIEASTENLAAGIYSYSIVVDGKTIDTKKMLKSK